MNTHYTPAPQSDLSLSARQIHLLRRGLFLLNRQLTGQTTSAPGLPSRTPSAAELDSLDQQLADLSARLS